jgi:putative ABC transport system permease protein
VGVAVGLALAFAATRALGGLLFQVAPTDPATFAAVPALLVAAATLAVLGPALRATRIDPVTALRWE